MVYTTNVVGFHGVELDRMSCDVISWAIKCVLLCLMRFMGVIMGLVGYKLAIVLYGFNGMMSMSFDN